MLFYFVRRLPKVDVLQFERSKNVPACSIELEWIGSSEPKPLFYQVNVTGTKKPVHFYMRYYPQAVGRFCFMYIHACMHARMHACTHACAHVHIYVILYTCINYYGLAM